MLSASHYCYFSSSQVTHASVRFIQFQTLRLYSISSLSFYFFVKSHISMFFFQLPSTSGIGRVDKHGALGNTDNQVLWRCKSGPSMPQLDFRAISPFRNDEVCKDGALVVVGSVLVVVPILPICCCFGHGRLPRRMAWFLASLSLFRILLLLYSMIWSDEV